MSVGLRYLFPLIKVKYVYETRRFPDYLIAEALFPVL